MPLQSLTPQSLQGRRLPAPSRLETEPLTSLLFSLEECSLMPPQQPHFRANQWNISPLSRTERIMLRHPSPSPQFLYVQRRLPCLCCYLSPHDLRLIAALGLVVLVVVYSLVLI